MLRNAWIDRLCVSLWIRWLHVTQIHMRTSLWHPQCLRAIRGECEIIISCQKKENLIKSFFRKRDKRTRWKEAIASDSILPTSSQFIQPTAAVLLTADGKVYFWPISFCHTFSTCPTVIASLHVETRSGDGIAICKTLDAISCFCDQIYPAFRLATDCKWINWFLLHFFTKFKW